MRDGASRALATILSAAALVALPADSLRTLRLDLPESGSPLDAGVDGAGNVVLLYPGYPRVVRLEEGEATELDLSETVRPGGLCVLEGGQLLVSDRAEGLIRRYDGEGALLEVMEAPGSPGDLAMVGLEVWYLSRDDCVVRTAGPGGRVVFRPPRGCRVRLSGGSLAGTACHQGAWLLRPGEAPEPIAARCLDAAMCGGGPVVLLDSLTAYLPPADTLRLAVPVSRAAGSPGGWLLLWSPASGTALLAR
jgi:hypothetical protein